ncbi:MAG: methyltransferase domain-containing protein [Deltaproteobacteria bacterium]|nr:methyltransferase domain-containing protein [Deltaproteobacteria bacterium]
MLPDQGPLKEDEWERLWASALEELGLGGAVLNSCSYHDPGRRTYESGGVIYKLVLAGHEITALKRAQDLRGEFEILNGCKGMAGVPEAIEWKRSGAAEYLAMRRINGVPLSGLDAGPVKFVSVLARLGVILARLGIRGISHNDINAGNILILCDGGVALIDFDQAGRSGFLEALSRSFLGIESGGKAMHGSYVSLVKDFMKKNMSPGTIALLKRLAGRDMSRKHRLPDLPANAGEKLKSAHWAWNLAQNSDASCPGAKAAYYSYEFQGVRFPGERPWKERWEVLSGITDYKGKRALELGCNMGLLSISLLREKKAKAALGVDADAKILESAKLLSSAHGVLPKFRQQDLDSPEEWEAELAEFKPDIVFALNVLNWVKDKDRLMSFLGRFNEVVFEGHDSVETETGRFRDAGFADIRLITTSERKRPVLHCRK